jgi:hypothetical protein
LQPPPNLLPSPILPKPGANEGVATSLNLNVDRIDPTTWDRSKRLIGRVKFNLVCSHSSSYEQFQEILLVLPDQNAWTLIATIGVCVGEINACRNGEITINWLEQARGIKVVLKKIPHGRSDNLEPAAPIQDAMSNIPNWMVLLSDRGDNSNSLFIAIFARIWSHFGVNRAPVSLTLAPILKFSGLFDELRR